MFNEKILKHAPWSISKSNLLGLCAKQYQYKYVLKEKESTKSAASRIGVVLHSLLEASLKDVNTSLEDTFNTIINTENAVAEATSGQIKETLTDKEIHDIKVKIPSIYDFAKRIAKFKEILGVTKELIEEKLAMRPDFSSAEFFDNSSIIRGVLDHGMITKDNCMIVLDHKSGKKKKIEEHSTQFYAYMLMVVANYNVASVQCGINYIGSDKVDWFPRPNGDSGAWTRAEINQTLRPWLVHYLNSNVNKLTVLDEDKKANPETGWQCVYCGYVDRCAAGKEELERRENKQRRGNVNL